MLNETRAKGISGVTFALCSGIVGKTASGSDARKREKGDAFLGSSAFGAARVRCTSGCNRCKFGRWRVRGAEVRRATRRIYLCICNVHFTLSIRGVYSSSVSGVRADTHYAKSRRSSSRER